MGTRGDAAARAARTAHWFDRPPELQPTAAELRRVRDHRGHHPWRAIGMLPAWTVEFVPAGHPDLEHGLGMHELGCTLHDQQLILVRDDLDVAGRRSVIAHETRHVLAGPVGRRRRLAEEAKVERDAARLLMPSVRKMWHALAWNHADHEAAAHDLWVDEQMLHARLSTLTPRERAWLDGQLATVWI